MCQTLLSFDNRLHLAAEQPGPSIPSEDVKEHQLHLDRRMGAHVKPARPG